MEAGENPVKYLSFIKKNVIMPTFCASSIIMLLILAFMELSGLTSKPALTLSNALLCTLLAFLFSLCNLILKIDKLTVVTRVLIHFVATILSLVAVALCTDYKFNESSLVLIVVYSVLYLIIVPIYFVVRASLDRKRSEKTAYKSIFSQRD